MEDLRNYINGKPASWQADFAVRCGTTIGYLRNAISTKKALGDAICISIERESGGLVRCESLRPDVDWAYLRSTKK